jgi:GrpB-like predicted nucleotidyltransferase (UPF0157 family)
MILVGLQQLNPEPEDYSLLISAFARLPKEVCFRGAHARMVGFETLDIAGAHLRFLGVEVESLDTVPEGLLVWELGADSWIVRQSNQGRLDVTWREAITWNWREPSHEVPSRFSGEFAAQGNPLWWGAASPGLQRFSMFANVHVDPSAKGFQDDVLLLPSDPAWPAEYERMAEWLRSRLGADIALRIEHYGSTAIPGLPAKPIIDILVQIPSFNEGRQHAIPALDSETWEYWWYGEHMVFFKRKAVMGERTHHVHLAPAGHSLWKGLAFRDYLRDHPDDTARYAALKQRLAVSHQRDREGYTQAKTAFVQEINEKALVHGYGCGLPLQESRSS